MLQKYQLQPLVICLSDFKVIGRIEVDQRKSFYETAHIHRVRVEGLNTQCSRLFRSIGVNLNSVSMSCCAFEQLRKCHAIPNTRIKCGKLRWEYQVNPETPSFRDWKWEKP